MEILDFITVTICGFGIGILSGMFGIGGGGLIVPLLHMAFGLPMLAATSTSLLTIAPTGISGSIKHLRQKTASLKEGLVMGGFGAIASVISSSFAGDLPEYSVVLITVAVILFSTGMMVRTMRKDKELEKTEAAAADKRDSADLTEASIESQGEAPLQESKTTPPGRGGLVQWLPRMVIGLIAGGIAGIAGVGGGFIIVPFCVAYMGFSLKQAAGTSLISIALIAIPGIITHAALGHIWWLYGLAIMIGTIPGALVGAELINKLPERPSRYAFLVFLTTIGLMMLVQEFLL